MNALLIFAKLLLFFSGFLVSCAYVAGLNGKPFVAILGAFVAGFCIIIGWVLA